MHPATLEAFRDEMEKIALIPDSLSGQQVNAGALGAGGAIAGTAVAQGALSGVFHRRASRLSNEKVTMEQARKLRDIMYPEGGVHLSPTMPRESGLHFHGSLDRAKDEIASRVGQPLEAELARAKTRGGGLSTSSTNAGPAVMAHELGHGVVERHRLGKLVNRYNMAGTPGKLLAGGTAIAGMGAAIQDPDSTASKLAPAISVAGAVPHFLSEQSANVRGLIGMHQAKLPMAPAINRLGYDIGRNFLKAAPFVAAPMITRQVMKHYKNKRQARSRQGAY